jgi:hypothetical protein
VQLDGCKRERYENGDLAEKRVTEIGMGLADHIRSKTPASTTIAARNEDEVGATSRSNEKLYLTPTSVRPGAGAYSSACDNALREPDRRAPSRTARSIRPRPDVHHAPGNQPYHLVQEPIPRDEQGEPAPDSSLVCEAAAAVGSARRSMISAPLRGCRTAFVNRQPNWDR